MQYGGAFAKTILKRKDAVHKSRFNVLPARNEVARKALGRIPSQRRNDSKFL